MPLINKNYAGLEFKSLSIEPSHYFRQCHPETCCCSGGYVLLALYWKPFDHSTIASKYVCEGSEEEMEELKKSPITFLDN